MSSLSSWDAARIRDFEERFLSPDYDDPYDENEEWLEADRRAEEEWFNKIRKGDL